jgi:hypothetical protein
MSTNETFNYTALPTAWPYVTVTEEPTPTNTPDIDPGMTPYTGPTVGTSETPEEPFNNTFVTPTEPPFVEPVYTAEVVTMPSFELPPGAFESDAIPTPTETIEPMLSVEPEQPKADSFLPRWLSYLLFIFMGISGVAGLAVVGSYLGARPPDGGTKPPVQGSPVSSPGGRLVQPEIHELPMDQQILIDRIAGFSPGTMRVERLGKNLLRLEQVARVRSQDRSLRLGRIISLAAVPSLPLPPAATAWAKAHGFRIISADGFGMALVTPVLSGGNTTVLGVLPVDRMVEGASPIPMPVTAPEVGSDSTLQITFLNSMGIFPPAEPVDGS